VRISHKYKFVFICVPKTGSTAVRRALDEYSDISSSVDLSYTFHITTQELKQRFIDNGWDWDEYFKFGFVRNPWESQVSRWVYDNRVAQRELVPDSYTLHESMNAYTLRCRKVFDEYPTFDLWVRERILRSSQFICDEDGDVMLDFVGRQEQLQEGFDEVMKRIGLPTKKLEMVNVYEHDHYSKYYNAETRELVAGRCAREIELFNYEFGK